MNGAMPSGNHHFGHGNSQRLLPRLHLHSGEIGAQTKRVSVLIGNRQASYHGSRANNTTLGLRIGSIIFGKSPTYQPATNLSEYIAKPVPCQSDSYSKQEPNVRTLWSEKKMMVSPMKLTVPSATPKQLSRSAYPNHLKTEQLVNNSRLCGRDSLAAGGRKTRIATRTENSHVSRKNYRQFLDRGFRRERSQVKVMVLRRGGDLEMSISCCMCEPKETAQSLWR